MSANTVASSTSAPVLSPRAFTSHRRHSDIEKLEGRDPGVMDAIRPARPSNGTLQIRQRKWAGIRLKSDCICFEPGSANSAETRPCINKSYQSESVYSSATRPT